MSVCFVSFTGMSVSSIGTGVYVRFVGVSQVCQCASLEFHMYVCAPC